MVSETFDKVKERAAKILGNPAVFPNFTIAEKLNTAFYNSGTAFEKSKDALEGTISDTEATVLAVLNAMRQAVAFYGAKDFGLSPQNPDDEKKIDQAREKMEGMLADTMAVWNENLTRLRELDKHIVQMGKYKNPQRYRSR